MALKMLTELEIRKIELACKLPDTVSTALRWMARGNSGFSEAVELQYLQHTLIALEKRHEQHQP